MEYEVNTLQPLTAQIQQSKSVDFITVDHNVTHDKVNDYYEKAVRQYYANNANIYGYHQHAAQQAPDDATAAYHQYYAQQAAVQHTNYQIYQQMHQQLNTPSSDAQNKKKATDNSCNDALKKEELQINIDDITRSQLQHKVKQLERKKNLRQIELEDKQKVFRQKKTLLHKQKKRLKELQHQWTIDKTEIIDKSLNIPSFIKDSYELFRQFQSIQKENQGLHSSLEQITNDLQSELDSVCRSLKKEKDISSNTHEHNIELERKVRELMIDKLELEHLLKTEKQQQANIEMNNLHPNDTNIGNRTKDKPQTYPPENTVIASLLRAQVEFYFSDYNLKRDKRLLTEVINPPKYGFLHLEQVLKLSRIRQLCSERNILENALRSSTMLTLMRHKKKETQANNDDISATYDIFVGRIDFEKPKEKDFPFRRTVFIFGIPQDMGSITGFLEQMLKSFGVVNKIHLTENKDTVDKKIGARFLNKPRIYTLLDDNGDAMIFKTSYDKNISGEETENVNIKCDKCAKEKAVSEGAYTTKQWSVVYCAQCAAQCADAQLNEYYKERKSEVIRRCVGSMMDKKRSALVVFASQRQASKCAYVRSRIGYHGAFATHFHHYSKVKKDIMNNNNNENDTLQPVKNVKVKRKNGKKCGNNNSNYKS